MPLTMKGTKVRRALATRMRYMCTHARDCYLWAGPLLAFCVALNPLVSLIGRLVARSGRKRGNRQTDRQNDKTTTVTLAAHARRGLIINIHIPTSTIVQTSKLATWLIIIIL